jgi:hypothetical protein
MSSLQIATTSLLRNARPSHLPAKNPARLSARLAIDEQTKTDAYAVRHKSYLSGGYIDPKPGGLFSDPDDLRPNAQSIVVYKDSRPVASVRLCTLDTNPALTGWDEIPASRIFPEDVAGLLASVPQKVRPPRVTEINRLVRHPDFATDYELVFVLFRFVSFMVAQDRSDMTLSCVRRNHTSFYKRLHFDYVAGPRRYAGVKFETNLMACDHSRYDSVLKDIPFVDTGAPGSSAYEGLLQGETVTVF